MFTGLAIQLSILEHTVFAREPISYLSAAPGGLQATAVCVCVGWMMGKVKDIYMHYIDSGDQFVGRCLALLPLLDSNFACSPPHFPSTTTDKD